METQNDLGLTIGTEEEKKLDAKPVMVKEVKVKAVGEKNNKKIALSCKHPDSLDEVEISAVLYINDRTKKITESGLWINLDSEGKIKKNSALASFLQARNVSSPAQLKGQMDVPTVLGEKGFLALKAY